MRTSDGPSKGASPRSEGAGAEGVEGNGMISSTGWGDTGARVRCCVGRLQL